MKKFTIYTIGTIIATIVLVFVTAAMAGITDNFYYFFDDAACTIGAIVVAMIGTWLIAGVYYAECKIAKKMDKMERDKRIEEYTIIAEEISKKLGL